MTLPLHRWVGKSRTRLGAWELAAVCMVCKAYQASVLQGVLQGA